MNRNICKQTDLSIVETPSAGMDGRSVECSLCGKYKITGTAEACIHEPNMKLTAWVRDQNGYGQTPTISSYTLEEINKSPDILDLEQKKNMIKNLFQEMAKKDETIRNAGGRGNNVRWELN
ncbi:MAG: hypothetical protein R8J85_07495 [Mariprofundales bacterium]